MLQELIVNHLFLVPCLRFERDKQDKGLSGQIRTSFALPNPSSGLHASLPFLYLAPVAPVDHATLHPMETQPVKNRGPRIEFRLTPEDDQVIRDRAAQAGLSVSEFMRRAALGVSIQAQLSPADLDNLRKIGGNLNQVARYANTHQRWLGEIEILVDQLKAILKGN